MRRWWRDESPAPDNRGRVLLGDATMDPFIPVESAALARMIRNVLRETTMPKMLTDGEREVIRELEADARPDATDADPDPDNPEGEIEEFTPAELARILADLHAERDADVAVAAAIAAARLAADGGVVRPVSDEEIPW